MTDNEIIKALECCRNNEREDECKYCLSCPMAHCDLDEDEELNCMEAVLKRAIDIINRQKAEIERLKNAPNVWKDIAHRETNYVAQAKSEAIKEFAERLKEKAYLDGAVSISQELVVDVRDIDNLVEEMTVNHESSKQRKEDEGK